MIGLERLNRTLESRPITFSQFMEYALYDEEQGYYTCSRPKLGRQGDFFTNAHVGRAVIGSVIYNYIYQWWSKLGSPISWALIEIGGGDGAILERLLSDLLINDDFPKDCLPQIYVIEQSKYHRELQQSKLQSLPLSIQFVDSLDQVPQYLFSIIYSNELFDALPFHRLVNTGEKVREIYVSRDKDLSCHEVTGGLSNQELDEVIRFFDCKLPKDHILEVSLNSKRLIYDIATWMQTGYLLTIDYGFSLQELLGRKKGTLRCYNQHTLNNNPYLNLCSQDITCHVNTTFLASWMAEAGLVPVCRESQSQFLLNGGILDLASPQVVKQLVHPDAMGEAFFAWVDRKINL